MTQLDRQLIRQVVSPLTSHCLLLQLSVKHKVHSTTQFTLQSKIHIEKITLYRIPHLQKNPKSCSVLESSPHDFHLSRINTFHILTPYFCTINCNVKLQYTPWSFEWPIPADVSTKCTYSARAKRTVYLILNRYL